MNRQTRAGRLALCAAAVAALSAVGEMCADTNSVLVQTGVTNDPGPGGGIISTIGDRPSINSSGQMAFYGNVTGSSDGTTRSVIRAETAGILTSIFRNAQAAPGSGGGTYFDFAYPTINGSGQVMTLNTLVGTSDTSSFGFFRGDGTAQTSLIRQMAAAPGTGGGTLNSSSGWNFNDLGAITATWSIAGAPGSAAGIFQGNNGTITAVVRQGAPAIGTGGGTFASFSAPNTNNLGHVAFLANLDGTTNGSSQGVFRFNGLMAQVTRNGLAAPGGGNFSGFFGIPILNNAGQVAFLANIIDAGDAANAGIFRGNASSPLVAIARHNQPAPGGGTFGGSIGNTDMLQNSAGQVLFQSGIESSPDGSTQGIFRGDGNDVISIARAGAAVAGGGSIAGFSGDMGFTSGGAAVFTANLSGTPGGAGDNFAMYLSDGRDMVQVVRKGQSMSGSTVAGFSINLFTYANGFNAVNDAGQVAYLAQLADGSTAVVRFLPSLHWREPFGGNWDNGNNWTLGINPAAVHEVLIDPQFGTNVTGPAGNVIVASLLVAGKESTASLNLNAGGILQVNGLTTIKSTGQISVGSGRFQGGAVLNDGSLSVAVGGQLQVSNITNNNQININGPASVGGPITNAGFINVSHATLSGGQLTNFVGLNLDAGTISSQIINEVGGMFTARGTLGAPLTNRGTLNVNGLLNINSINNTGLITVDAGESIAFGGITNTGTITLNGGGITSAVNNGNGGIIQGGGGISNTINLNSGALLYANNPTYALSASFTNIIPGARVRVADGSTLNATISFNNSGVITLGGDDANLNAPGITNAISGIISGAGTINGSVNNQGTIRAEGGQLLITGAASANQNTALVQVDEDATLVYSSLTNNNGTINVSGGSFINTTVSTFSNGGRISGWGTFTSPNFFNSGLMTFTGGFTVINGTVNNSATRKIEVANNPALFTGNVTNFGIFKNTKTSITFAGTYTENGTFISDPADNFFSSVIIGDEGAWVGGVGDRFFVSGDLRSSSTNRLGWQTVEAELRLMGGVEHLLSISGEDRGMSFDGYSDNFGWGALAVDAGDSLALADANDVAGGAMYVRQLLLGGGVGQISRIKGNGLSIFYHLGDPANAYLGGATYSLAGGGQIAPVPEPTMLVWALGGIAGLLYRRRRCQ